MGTSFKIWLSKWRWKWSKMKHSRFSEWHNVYNAQATTRSCQYKHIRARNDKRKMWTASKYFDNLSSDEKRNYKRKLTLTNGEILPDPWWWWFEADIGWPNIYSYLIDTPSHFTKENLKAYKSLAAYNFFVCGHVQDVFHHQVTTNTDFCFIKSRVGIRQISLHKKIVAKIFCSF